MGADADDPLAARLRAIDPAASMVPATRDQVAQWQGDVMADSSTATRARGWLVWAAAAVVLVLGGVGLALVLGDGRGPGDTVASDQPSVTTITVPEPSSAKCMVVNLDVLRAQEFAFAGTVTTVADGVATLEVSHWYRGGDTALVEVKAPNKDLQLLLSAVDFQQGKAYLVSGTGDTVTLCGFSALATPELTALYDEAYGG